MNLMNEFNVIYVSVPIIVCSTCNCKFDYKIKNILMKGT